MTTISEYAFSYCQKLTELVIPDSVTSIGANAFSRCENITVFVYEGSTAHNYCMEKSVPYELMDDLDFT